ncbi:MAG: prephenate dehydrogenase/arogenate dehydrogenase family protein [Acidimicrobiia bacterium]|nr:prephenate dehydrogenase/arogenate dehydrogenase family protein [Acidimicrobiia bacterium]
MRHAGIVGLGLIGGSIGAGLVAAGWDVTGYDADPDHAAAASDRRLASRVVASVSDVLAGSPDVIVVAVPPKATIECLAGLATDTVVMDVAGVKGAIVPAGRHLPNFVGTHPMAGRETAGPNAASPSLFRGAAWVVMDDATPVARDAVQSVVDELGARVVTMSAVEHDAAVARISHVPQLLAGALLATAADGHALPLAAGSFRDLTRVGASQPIPWVEILRDNADEVLGAIGDLKGHLAVLEAAILTNDDALLSLLSVARETRRSMGAPAAEVRIALADQPGEIARVGHALEATGVDVRDLQLRHAPHGGGGVMTISVRPGHEDELATALEREGLLLVP